MILKLREPILIALLVASISGTSLAQGRSYVFHGTYVDVLWKHNSIDLKQVGDSLLGNECFVTSGGDRIDWCDPADGYSMRLRRVSNGYFLGRMTDCYDGGVHDIKIIQHGTNFTLIFTKNSHPFEPDTMTFAPERKRRNIFTKHPHPFARDTLKFTPKKP